MANQFLTKKVAKATFDIDANYTAAVTNAGGRFAVAGIDATADTLTIPLHIFNTGDVVRVITAAGGTIPTAPAAATNYWVINVDENTVALATSLALATAGTKTALTVGAAAGYNYLVKDAGGAVDLGVAIPSGAIVTDAFIDITSTFLSLNVIGTTLDTATIALSIEGANDLVAAISIATGTIWDAGRHGTLAGSFVNRTVAGDTAILDAASRATALIKTTAERQLTATIATAGSLVQGKMDIYVEYVF